MALFILAGFKTASRDEVPEILYVGDDGEECGRIAEASAFPKVAQLRNPQWQALRHWSEEAAEAFAKAHASPLLPEPPASETAATEEKSEVAAEPADDDEVPLIPGGTRKRR